MKSVKPKPGWRRVPGGRAQSGQAMIYGLFVIVGAVVGLFFLFNTGQLTREKTKLVNASDAVAYSAAVMNARTLNYEAYLNRAMLANTVAIAQLVSLSSWVEYVGTMGTGGSSVNWSMYMGYWPSYWFASTAGSALGYLNDMDVLEDLAKASDELVRDVLMTSQRTAYMGSIPARLKVMEEVAKANYRNDGDIAVDPLPLATRDITGFVSRYSDQDRTRFAEAAQVAANKDGFVRRRSWLIPATWAECEGYAINWLSRRGGTNLIGFDEWKALDTLSEWRWYATFWGCVVGENTIGYGGRLAADNQQPDAPTDLSYLSRYDYSRAINPGSSAIADLSASSDTWGYSGLPNFYDLSESALDEDDPKLTVAVRLRRKISETVTSEGRSNIRGGGNPNPSGQSLNNFKAKPAGGNELVAVSSAEVYFERGDNNAYGDDIGKPREIGSLFNPFWRVHLVDSTAAAHAAQVLQGAYIP